MGDPEMERVADLLVRALTTGEPADRIRAEVRAFMRDFAHVHFAV